MISRRQILKTVPMLAGMALAGFPLSVTAAVPRRKLVAGKETTASILDLSSGKETTAPLGFMPHGFFQHPRDKDKVWAIERWDYAKAEGVKDVSSVAEIDIRAGKTLRQFPVPVGSGFFGHAFFSSEGDVIFISRVDIEKGESYVTGYDTGTFRQVANFQIQPGAVHECRLLPDGTVMAACTGVRPLKGKSHLDGVRVTKDALVRLELKSGRILDSKTVEDDGQMLGHCYFTKEGTSIVLSRPRPDLKENGRVYFSKDGAALRAVELGAEISKQPGECLSIAVNEKDHRAVVTNPENKSLLVVDVKEGALVRKIDGLARGVAYDEVSNQFIASGDQLHLLDARASRFETWPKSKMAEGPFTSPHNLLI